jgi:hypothetical protein
MIMQIILPKCSASDGECCCICQHQVLLMDNKSNNAFGFGCKAFLDEERVIYCHHFEHGRCELFMVIQD